MRLWGTPRLMDPFLEHFRPAFNAAQYSHFRRYVAGLVLAPGRRTVTSISRLYLDAADQSVLSRFLVDPRWSRSLLARLRRTLIAELVAEQATREQFLIIDDTVLKRSDGRRIEGVGVHHAGKGKNCTVRGHCIVTSHLLAGELSLPMDLRLYDKSRPPAGDGRGKIALACRLVKRTVLPRGRRSVFMADSWYLCRNVVDAVSRRGWDWIFALRANRVIWLGGRSLRVGKLLRLMADDPGQNPGAQAWGTVCILPGVGRVQVAFWRLPGKGRNLRCLVTNRLDWPPSAVVARYARRSRIEIFYWSAKRYLGLGDYLGRKAAAARTHWEFVFCAYVVLVALDHARPRRHRLRCIGRIRHRLTEQAFVDSLQRAYTCGRLGEDWSLARCAETPALYHAAANAGA